MAKTVYLHEAIDEILDALKGQLEAATVTPVPPAEAGLLADVATVVIGERSRPRPQMPALWVFGGVAVNTHVTAGLRETWELPVDLVAVVQGDDPEAAYRLATSVAARARTIALEDRRLDLAYVNDIVSTRFESSRQFNVDNRTIYSAAATVTVRFSVYERS